MQILWVNKLEWDEIVSETMKKEWEKLYFDLDLLEQVKIPCWYEGSNAITTQLIGFCDALTAAYSTVIYIRTIKENESIETHLIMAKTRVAPIHSMSIPRIE